MKKLILSLTLVLASGCPGTGLTTVTRYKNGASVGSVDKIIPTLSISSASSSVVNQSLSVQYTVNYQNADAVTLNSADILVNATGSAACVKTVTPVASNQATVTLQNCTGDGSVAFQIASGSARSPTGDLALASLYSASFTSDNSGPSGASSSIVSGTYSVLPTSLTFTFPESMDGVSISAADFSLGGTCSGIGVGGVTTLNATTTLTLTGTGACTLGQTLIVTANMNTMNDWLGNAGSGSAVMTYTLDNAGPASGTFSPAAGSMGPTSNSLTLSFPEAVDSASVSVADFSVGGTCVGVNVASVSLGGGSATLSLAGLGGCSHGQSIIVSCDLTGMTDLYGNAGTGAASVTYTFDRQGPVASFSVASGPVSNLPTALSLTLSSDTDMASVTPGQFAVGGTCPGVSIGGLSKLGTTATVSLVGTGGCAHGQTLNLNTSLATVNDTLGNAGVGSAAVTLTLDTQGPASTFSLSTSAVVSMPTAMTVTFPPDTDMGSVSAADFSVGGTCGASLASVSITGSVATLNLGGTGACTDGQTVTVAEASTGIADLLGNLGLGSQNITLTLSNAGPSGSFSILSGAIGLIPTSVTLNLSLNTDMNSLTAADISVGGTCGATLGAVNKVGSVFTINLNGTATCTNGQSVLVSVNWAGVTDNLTNPGSGTLNLNLVLDNVGPAFAFNTSSGRHNPLPAVLTATFSADTDMSTVTVADFIVTGTCAVSLGSVTKLGQVATLNLVGTGACLNGQTLIVTSNPLGVLDLMGNAGLNLPVIATYTFDNVAPLSLMVPVGIPMVILPTSVVVTFDLDTDMTSVTVGTFSMGGTCAVTVASVVKVANVATVNLSGMGACSFGKTMVITTIMTGVLDFAGNAGVGTPAQTFTKL